MLAEDSRRLLPRVEFRELLEPGLGPGRRARQSPDRRGEVPGEEAQLEQVRTVLQRRPSFFLDLVWFSDMSEE